MLQRTFLAAGLLLVAACDEGNTTGTRLALSLHVAHDRWERRGIESYELTVTRLCFCVFTQPVRVKVVDGVVVSRTVVPTGEPVPAPYASDYPGVPGLFAIVQEAARDADEVHTEFNGTYGYPTKISVDWTKNAVDDEVVYLAEDFRITPGCINCR
ncbi:MAG TPA: DUF6174 domain-containing protein [Gemmatimonadaceae bacterium]|nr:DUF6174 domain-containing protein [Gemmatimonadaceae bacterium]